jgi:hypothetical protein
MKQPRRPRCEGWSSQSRLRWKPEDHDLVELNDDIKSIRVSLPHPLESGLCQNRGALLEVVVIALGQDDDCFWIRAARYPMWIGDHAVPPEIIGGSEIGAGKVESESSNAC